MPLSGLCRPCVLLIVALGLGAQDAKPAPAQKPIQASAQAPAPAWPVPPGWGHETIPFPLDFAPELKHQGVEELRFMPGFFDPASPNRWSYAFLWKLSDAELPSRAQLESELVLYFKGLCTEVGGKKFKMDPTRFASTLSQKDRGTFEGRADLYDAFKTGEPISLRLEIRAWSAEGHAFVAFIAAPVSASPEVRKALDSCLSQIPTMPIPPRNP